MNRLLTVPNAISVARLACVPWFVYLVFSSERYFAAAVLLAVLGTTDWVDGQVARRFNQVTNFGRVFDPTVDRIMLGTAAITLLFKDAMPLWFGVVALSRELFVGIGGVILYSLGAKRIDVQFVGKAGAMALMLSLPLFLASISDVSWHQGARWMAYVFGVPGLVLSWYSAVGYVGLAKVALDKGARDSQPTGQ